jgi:hypothetical protein
VVAVPPTVARASQRRNIVFDASAGTTVDQPKLPVVLVTP